MIDPVPKHLRNPRRAYDRDGREIAPARVGSSRASGDTTLAVFCHACDHTIILGLDGLPDELALPDVPSVLRLRCRCGSREIGVMLDMHAHYARCREMAGQAVGTLPAGYRVVPWRDVVGAEVAGRIAPDAEKAPQPKPGRQSGDDGCRERISQAGAVP